MNAWTDDFSFYLEPVEESFWTRPTSKNSTLLYDCINKYEPGKWPDLEAADVVIIGLENGQHATRAIRQQLYALHLHNAHLRIADLGNIRLGGTANDTFIAIRQVIGGLALRNSMAILIGGSQELTYANYAAYEALEATVNVAILDSTVDLEDHEEEVHPRNYLSKIITHKPSYLFNVSILGYQNYLNSPDTITLIDKMYFDAVRLGELRKDIKRIEPHLRNADIVSFDMEAMSNASAPGSGQPNGFSAEEACQISRYAGLSDCCSSFGVYNYSPEKDPQGQTAALIAQMIWHVIDGVGGRIREYPLMSRKEFMEYKVQLNQNDEPITFFKSKRTEKWWMNVPYPVGNAHQLNKNFLIPCNYVDYEQAAAGDVPDLWWRTYRKLT